jgi:serine/threonine protein kinase
MPEIVTHPSARALALFSSGKLSEAQAATVAAHLALCADCRRATAGATLTAGQTPARSPGPAAPPVPPELLRHPKFRIVREVGRGGMGVVYLAEHRVMNRPVAIKVINDDLLAADDAAARLLAEVRAAARLDHQNIVRAFDAEHVGGLHLLVMEFVDGMSLAQLLEKKGPLSVTAACHCAGQAARGLQHAFERGMTHRDVKPHNLMLSPEGRVKILDFGIARVRSEQAGQTRSRLTRQDAFIGTPEYVAPEQAIDARKADTRSDIYSLGCTLYALLAGRPPFVGETAVQVVLAHVENRPRPLPELRSDVPPELWAVVAKMLAKDPARRYQTPLEAGRALAPFCKADSPPRPETACLSGAAIAPVGIVLDDGAGHVPPPPRRRSVAEPGTDRPGPATEDEPFALPPAMVDHAWEAAAKQSKARMLLIAGGVVGAVVVGLALVVALTIGGKTTPQPASPLLADEPPGRTPPRPSPDTRRKGPAPATDRDRGSTSTGDEEPDPGHGSPPKPLPNVDDGERKPSPGTVPPPSPGTGPTPTPSGPPHPGNKPAEDAKKKAAGLVKQLDKSFSEQDRITTLKALGELGPDAKDIAGKAVARCMVDSSKEVGLAARDALQKIDPTVAEECIIVVRDKDDAKRLRSLETLAKLGKEALSATPILMDMVDKVIDKRVTVAQPSKVIAAGILALVAIAPDDERLPQRLVKYWLVVPDERVQLAAIDAVTRVKWHNNEDKRRAVTRLMKHVRAGGSPAVKAAAANALGDFGPDAKAAAGALEAARGDSSDDVRKAAERALDRIRAKP